MSNQYNNSRRKFLGHAGCAAMGGTTLFSTLFNLKSMGAAAALNSSLKLNNGGGDYKALVCILLDGGMDAFNMLIPRSQPHYSQYATTRTNLAIPLGSLRHINQITPDGKEYGLHPAMQHTQNLFNTGKLSFVSNVGTLIQPTTKAQYFSGNVPLPLGLYSHSDQVAHWQTGTPHARTAQGWGGKIADMMAAANDNSTLSMSFSLSGSNLYQSGNTTTEFSILPTQGAVQINGYNNNDWIFNKMRTTAINGMINESYQNAFKKTYASKVKTGIDGSDMLKAVLENAPTFNTPFENPIGTPNYAGDFIPGLKQIAKTISGRASLGMTRQIFFISLGGWDMHEELLVNQNSLLQVMDAGLKAFNDAMVQLGVDNDVTTFSLSDFARTLGSNDGNAALAGTDHAWGTNTFVMGGAVNGQEIYGTYPSLVLGNSNPDEVYGTLIPTTSADQYMRDIALWFGVPPSDIPLLFPNIGNFSSTPLGFL